MRHIIDAIAAQGRNGDDTLIHVSKKELGLLKNAGDRLGIRSTVNPKTGLHEAFNWLGTLGGIAGGVAGTFVAPGAGTAAGAALGSAAGTAAGGGTTKQALTAGLISGVTAYAGGAALGSMSEAGAAGVDAAVTPAVTDTVAPAITDTVAPAVTDATTNTVANTGTTATTDAAGNTLANTAAPPPTTPASTAPAPTPEPTAPTTEPSAPQDTGIKGPGLRMPQAGDTGGLRMPSEGGDVGAKIPEGGGLKTLPPTKPEFSMANVNQYLKDTPMTDVAKKYGADFAKTAMGVGMTGMVPVGEPAPIEVPGKESTTNPYKAEYYQGPEGEIRTRAVRTAAAGGSIYGDYDGVEDAAAGGIMGYAGGGTASTAGGGISALNTGTTSGNVAAKTGPVLSSGFFSKDEYARATPAQRAEMDRLMAAQREMVPSPTRKQFAEGGIASYSFGGMTRQLQPGGAFGDWHAKTYGAISNATGVDLGGALGNITPGANQYHDKKDAERAAEEDRQRQEAEAAQKVAAQNKLNTLRDETMARNMAGGGIASMARGRYLQGPGDGMSDSIPADIDGKQPARLATGEFVVSADVVSGLGNGDSTAGAKQLHAMMDRVRQSRTGTKKQGKQINPRKMMPV